MELKEEVKEISMGWGVAVGIFLYMLFMFSNLRDNQYYVTELYLKEVAKNCHLIYKNDSLTKIIQLKK